MARSISHISPKKMQIKRVCIMHILAKLPSLQVMREKRQEEARKDEVADGRWDRVVSQRGRIAHRNVTHRPPSFEN